MMTHRERILAAIRGDVPDRLPWVPRLEFWYRAHLRRGTLPSEFRSLSLAEVIERLNIGYYAVLPDLADCATDTDMIDRALGIFRVPVIPYEAQLDGVDRRVIHCGEETIVEYHTPVGSIRTTTMFTDEMLDGGVSTPCITGPAIREPKDFEVVGYIFSHLKVSARSAGYMAVRERVGDRGIVVGYASGSACPIHHIMRVLMPLEQFVFAMQDCPEKIERLVDQMQPYYQSIRAIAADCPAEVIHLGGNYDESVTHPAFFRKHIVPALSSYAEVLHFKGKYLLTHTDGENRRLLPLYLKAGIDIADSVCPYPMTSCQLEEIREVFGERITILGGIPSVLLCPGSVDAREFRRHVDELVERYEHQSHLILGVSDMVTADADWERLCYITDKIAGAV